MSVDGTGGIESLEADRAPLSLVTCESISGLVRTRVWAVVHVRCFCIRRHKFAGSATLWGHTEVRPPLGLVLWAWPEARGEHLSVLRAWLVLTPGPCPLELHLAALPRLRPACAPGGRGSSPCSLGELIAVWGFWPYLLSGTICGNLIPFFSTMRLLDNAVH